jgi:hypothetical protein
VNVCGLATAALAFQQDWVQQFAIDYISDHADEVLDDSSFDELPEELVELIISGCLFTHELRVFEAVRRWGVRACERAGQQATPAHVKAATKTLMLSVRLHLIACEDLVEVVEQSGIVEVERLYDAIKYRTVPALMPSTYLPRESFESKYVHDWDGNGILYWLGTQLGAGDTWCNPALDSSIAVTSSSQHQSSSYLPIDRVVNHRSYGGSFYTQDAPDQWIMSKHEGLFATSAIRALLL